MIAIARNWRDAGLSEQDLAMLEYCEKLTVAPSTVTAADVERLRLVGFGDEEILDINLLCAYRNFITRVADGLGVELNEEYLVVPDMVDALLTGKQLRRREAANRAGVRPWVGDDAPEATPAEGKEA